jgi:hypothetical protein
MYMEISMQDLDLYTGKQNGMYNPPRFESPDPEYFSRMNDNLHREDLHVRKRASRIIAFVAGLCIVSFTAGLVIGIKFAGGADKSLVDPRTKRAVAELGQRVSGVAEQTPVQAVTDPATPQNNASATYPKAEYPFVIRLGSEFVKEKADEIASFLSSKGHTVVLSKNGSSFRVYAGPFRTMESAEISLQKIRGYNDNRWQNSAMILKR